MKFVTLEKSDPLFHRHLMGHLSDGEVPIPVESLHVNSNDEKVTFQILDKDKIIRPSIWIVILKVMRIDLIAFTLFPPIAVFSVALAHGQPTSQLGFVLLSLFFLHGAVFCRNDFADHLNGVDRVNEKGGSRVIQNGWLRATSVQKLYRVLIFLAVFFAGPVLMRLPQLLWLAAIGGGLGVLGYTFLRRGLGWLAGDLSVFIALGPLLTLGANIVASKPISTVTALFLGSGFGLGVVIYLEIRHLISQVVDDTAGFRTLPVWLGFDRAKTAVASMFVLMGLMLVASFLTLSLFWGVIAGSLYIVLMAGMALRTKEISSPLSSVLPTLLKEATLMHIFYGIIFMAYSFF